MKMLSDHPTEILILLFLIVTFMQSGIDKITDWKGNVGFIKSHFKNSPLKNNVPFLLAVILTIEIVAGIFMIIGTYQIYSSGQKEIALIGIELSAVALLVSVWQKIMQER